VNTRIKRTTPARSDSSRFICLALSAAGALLGTLCLLSGCGGGSGAPPAARSVVTSAPPTPSIDVTASLTTVKQLTLAWSSPGLALAQRALVLEDVDGDGPLPAERRADVPAADGQATIEVFLPATLHATYQVGLCTEGQCVFSSPLAIAGHLATGVGRLKALDPIPGAEFGAAVALSRNGQVLAVGALYETLAVTDGSDKHGAVHLFERGVPGQAPWLSRGRVQAPNPGTLDRFGGALALSADGRVLAVGAYHEDALGSADQGANDAAAQSGAVYVFRRQADEWVFSAYLKGSEVGAQDRFGSSLSLSGNGLTLAIGAPRDDGPGDTQPEDGAVYVFSDIGGTWTETRLLRDGSGGDGIGFGTSLSLSDDGTALAVGSPNHHTSGVGAHSTPINDTLAPFSGAVYLYRLGTDWALESFIKAPLALGVEAQFGYAVSLDAHGDTLLASARDADLGPDLRIDDSNFSNSGSAHVYVRSAGLWVAHGQPLRPPLPAPYARFGLTASLSADGQTALIGTYNNRFPGVGVTAEELPGDTFDFGAAYVFSRRDDGWGSATVLKPSDHTDDDDALSGLRMGHAVALSGDGRTAAVGAATHDGPGSGLSPDPTIDYDFPSDPALVNSGTVFLY